MAELLYYATPFFLLLLGVERNKVGVAFRGPGWTPPGVTESEATRG